MAKQKKTEAPAQSEEAAQHSGSEFDPALFRTLVEVGSVQSGKARLVVAVKQYDTGAPRVRVDRAGVKKDGTPYTAKLGGLSVEESREVGKLLVKAADELAKIAARG